MNNTRNITADEWNAAHPVGTNVTYMSHPSAEPVATITRSTAWTLGSGDAVVAIDGRAGGVVLWALTVTQ